MRRENTRAHARTSDADYIARFRCPGTICNTGVFQNPYDFAPGVVMHRTHLSLYYLFSYLIFAGLSLLVAPQFALRLLLSDADYGDVLPRLPGVILLALGIVVMQIVRLKVQVLYSTTLIVRSIILICLFGLYSYSRNPLFLVLVGIVALGVTLTGASFWLDRRE